MERAAWREQVIIDPQIHHGDPCIRGTRIPVRILIGSLADGMTPEEVIAAYPQLTQTDVYAALAYAAEVLHEEIVLPLSPR
ncbi:MAG: DUF433 domain-containing protein [Candidatus Hydrogenedentes bacterium]|nr:DUF433 domain-containing protein [Candidatus Hydrogenedentota bacterium]